MIPFSRHQSKINAIKKKQRIAHQKLKTNPSYRIKHVAEARDADKNMYTLVDKRIKEETEKAQDRTEKFRSKLHDK